MTVRELRKGSNAAMSVARRRHYTAEERRAAQRRCSELKQLTDRLEQYLASEDSQY